VTQQIDPIHHYKAYIDYALTNPYRSLITSSQAASYLDVYEKQCLPGLETCNSSGSNADCQNADQICINQIEESIVAAADFDVYDLRAPSNDPFPPETYSHYLQDSAIQAQIGAQQNYTECANAPNQLFTTTGDGKRHPSKDNQCY